MVGIPAASVADVDIDAVARRDPTAAREIARIGELLRFGKETDEDFCTLIRLLYEVGEVAKAEHLLRRNLDLGADSHALYLKLFGTKKEDEFRGAIRGFQSQFGVGLRFIKRSAFLVECYESEPGTSLAEAFALLGRRCRVTFDYVERDHIHADAVLLDPGRVAFKPHECLLMHWVDGAWLVVDPLSA